MDRAYRPQGLPCGANLNFLRKTYKLISCSFLADLGNQFNSRDIFTEYPSVILEY
jgi:hypothetical protein